MNRIMLKCREKVLGDALYMSLIYNVLFVSFILLFGDVVFQTNDDNGMSHILYGGGEHLIYINYIIGKLLQFLLTIFPNIPWYAVSMYVVMFISFVVWAYVLFKRDCNWGLLLYSIVMFFYGGFVYTSLQFTQVAAVSTIAGILLLFDSMQSNNINILGTVVAGALLIGGMAYRSDMFYMAFASMSGYGLYCFLKSFKIKEKRTILRYVISFCSMLVLCLGVAYIDQLAYQSNEEWKNYQQFNAYRAELLDYSFPDYATNEALYKELGITEQDVKMYRSWDFADPQKFNVDTTAQLVLAKEERVFSLEDAKSFFQWFPKELLRYEWISGFLIIAFIATLLNKKNIVWCLYNFAVVFAIQFYFHYIGRYLQMRVDVGLFMALTIMLAIILLEGLKNQQKLTLRFSATITICLWIMLAVNQYTTMDEKLAMQEEKQQSRELCQLIGNDGENLYLARTVNTTLWNEAYGVWDVVPKGIKKNFSLLGGWGTYMPSQINQFKRHGINNPFEDMVDNEKVYLVSKRDVSQIIDYIRRNYNSTARAYKVKDINGYQFYRVTSKPLQLEIDEELLDPKKVKSGYSINLNHGKLRVDGYTYIRKKSSYKGEAYLEIEYEDGITVWNYLTQKEMEEFSGDEKGQFAGYECEMKMEEEKNFVASIYYKHDDKVYLVQSQNFLSE